MFFESRVLSSRIGLSNCKQSLGNASSPGRNFLHNDKIESTNQIVGEEKSRHFSHSTNDPNWLFNGDFLVDILVWRGPILKVRCTYWMLAWQGSPFPPILMSLFVQSRAIRFVLCTQVEYGIQDHAAFESRFVNFPMYLIWLTSVKYRTTCESPHRSIAPRLFSAFFHGFCPVICILEFYFPHRGFIRSSFSAVMCIKRPEWENRTVSLTNKQQDQSKTNSHLLSSFI